MNANNRDIYIMRGDAAAVDDEEGWLVPEPADDVIVDEIVEGSELSADDIEPLSDYVDYEELHELLAGDDSEELTFGIEDIEVTVIADGSVSVSN